MTALFLLLLVLVLLAACRSDDPDTPVQTGEKASSPAEPETVLGDTSPTTDTASLPETTAQHTSAATTLVETTTPETTAIETTAVETTAPETTVPETTERVPDGSLPFVPSAPTRFETNCKAMWLSQFDLTLYYLEGGVQRAEADFREKIAMVLGNVVGDGFNTVMVQVRPYGDSLYPSDYYPAGRLAVGVYGRDFTYDPFAIIVESAREKGLSVHAWINPMRAMTDEEIRLVDDRFLIKTWYNDPTLRGDYLFLYEGRWYLNPAHAAVRDLITAGVAEILERYEVDGIHMDDYFYPSTDPNLDAASYMAFRAEGGKTALSDWRRDNLDALVSELYATVKAHDLSTIFGISPSGVIDTVYHKQYADVYKWCREPGYIDYICPQLYFGFEHETADFVTMCELWQSMIKTDYVTLLIGLSFGKAAAGEDPYAGSGMYEWAENRDILVRALQHTTTLPACEGVIVFSYQHLFDLTTGEVLAATQEEHAAFRETLPTVTWRREEILT